MASELSNANKAEADHGAPNSAARVGQDLTVGSEYQHLLRLTGFMLLGFVAVMSANLIETLYIGKVGTQELAALGFTFPVVMGLQGMMMGLGIGASSVVARSIGSGEWRRAKALITHSFVLVLAFVALITLLMALFLEDIFSALGATGEIRDMSVEYMRVWLLGVPFFAIAMVGSTLMRAAGDAVKPGYLMVVGAVLQVALGPVFIFGLFGFSQMGLAGAAIAFVAARTVSFLMYVYYVYKDDLLVFDLTNFWQSSRDIMHVGLPAILSNIIGPVSMSVITRLLAGHGAVVVAGFSVASRIETMFAMVMWALSMSVAPFVGQNWGAKYFKRVTRSLRIGNVFALAWGVFSYLVLIVLGPFVISLVNSDQEVIDAATIYLMIVPLGMGLMGVMSNCMSSFNALGQPGPPFIMSVCQMLFLSIPFAIIGDYLFGYHGIFAGGVLSILIIALVSYVWLKRNIRFGELQG